MAKRFFVATGVCVAFSAAALYAQTPAAAPAFEVASIKPVDMPGPAQAASGKIHVGMKIDAARVDIGLFSLTDLICKAYDVKKFQVSGPDWLGTQRFDVIAKMPEGATKDQVPQMLQNLLAERFKLEIKTAANVQRSPGPNAKGPLANPKLLAALFTRLQLRSKFELKLSPLLGPARVLNVGSSVRFELS